MAAEQQNTEVLLRQDAKESGKPHYFTGQPCANGHFSVRSVATRQCLACTAAAMRRIRGARQTAPRQTPVVTDGLISRREATNAKLPHYFTGIPCRRGHLAKRTTRKKRCVECHREDQARRRADDPGRDKAIKAASYRKHAAEVRAHVRAYQAKNAPAIRERQKAFREANKGKIAERMKEWSKANRPKLRVHERRRRDRKRGATGSHTLADIQDIGRMQRWRCASPACRRSIRDGYHIDHIRPLAKGGTDDRRNIQLLCQQCNQAKHARDPVAWAQSLGLLL